MKKFVLFVFIMLISCVEDISFRLQEIDVKKIEFAKPTGIFYSPIDTAFFITTFDGILAKCDTNFQTIKSKQFEGYKFSQIFVDEFFIYLISSKGLIKIDKYTMEIISKTQLSNLGVKFNDVKGIYFNSIDKTFDLVVQEKKYTTIVNYNPINLRRVKTKKLTKIKKTDCAFSSTKYLFVLDNENKTIKVLDLTNEFYEVRKFKFSAPEITSMTKINLNTFVLLSSETRRAFIFKANEE